MANVFTIFVDGLPNHMNSKWLTNSFKSVGEISDVYVSYKRRNYSKFVFGFVRFRFRKDAEFAISKFNGRIFSGHPLRVCWANNQRKMFTGNINQVAHKDLTTFCSKLENQFNSFKNSIIMQLHEFFEEGSFHPPSKLASNTQVPFTGNSGSTLSPPHTPPMKGRINNHASDVPSSVRVSATPTPTTPPTPPLEGGQNKSSSAIVPRSDGVIMDGSSTNSTPPVESSLTAPSIPPTYEVDLLRAPTFSTSADVYFWRHQPPLPSTTTTTTTSPVTDCPSNYSCLCSVLSNKKKNKLKIRRKRKDKFAQLNGDFSLVNGARCWSDSEGDEEDSWSGVEDEALLDCDGVFEVLAEDVEAVEDGLHSLGGVEDRVEFLGNVTELGVELSDFGVDSGIEKTNAAKSEDFGGFKKVCGTVIEKNTFDSLVIIPSHFPKHNLNLNFEAPFPKVRSRNKKLKEYFPTSKREVVMSFLSRSVKFALRVSTKKIKKSDLIKYDIIMSQVRRRVRNR